jgi:5-formyltetrahydrofolate cyclo-ligase
VQLADEKRALRREMRSRALPSGAEALRAGSLAADAAQAHPRFTAAERIVLFASLSDELPTRPLFDAVCASGRVCLLPRILGGGRLDFAAVAAADWEKLVRGPFGAREPVSDAVSESLTSADLVFAPGLAFDRCGGRLGRGGGDYDRALAALAPDMPFVCGLAYACRLVERVPMGALDVRVDAFVSEDGWLDAEREAGA